jgi:WD40 repeat protein
LWSVNAGPGVERLAWSPDGQRLLVVSPTTVRVYTANGTARARRTLPRRTPAIDGALSPDGHTLALVLGGSANDVMVEDLAHPHRGPHRVLAGVGVRDVTWSPDGRWLLVSWPAADQWVFVRIAGAPRIAAVSRIAQQLSTGTKHGFPQLDGWCCTTRGAT